MAPGYWVLAAAAVILPLAVYAGVLAVRLRRREQQQREAEAARRRARAERQAQARLGIRLLAAAMIAEEITLTEGCQRISYLLGQLEPGAHPEEEVSVFFRVAEATAHLPILDAWRALDRRQQHAYNLDRASIEAGFRDRALIAAEGILARETSGDQD